jgi:hypothetical protein
MKLTRRKDRWGGTVFLDREQFKAGADVLKLYTRTGRKMVRAYPRQVYSGRRATIILRENLA